MVPGVDRDANPGIFLIRSRCLPWQAGLPHIALIGTSLGALAVALLLVLGPIQGWFGFVPLSWPLLGAMAAVTVAYLSAAEAAKHFVLSPVPESAPPTGAQAYRGGSGDGRVR
jgi:hypothetical protein